MPSAHSWTPLFPLKTVLFPGGVLPLKIFEVRYIDMVRDCMKRDQPFGVVLIKSGQEVGAAAEPESVGCLAHIVSWDMPEGLMMLRTQGSQRFSVLDTRVLPDQRLEARIEPIAPDVPTAIEPARQECASSLRAVIANIETITRAEHGDAFESPFARPFLLDDAGWVANRWCEILPIPLAARQKLLELSDPGMRLSIVHQYLQQHQII